jgi:hypothetical protein
MSQEKLIYRQALKNPIPYPPSCTHSTFWFFMQRLLEQELAEPAVSA